MNDSRMHLTKKRLWVILLRETRVSVGHNISETKSEARILVVEDEPIVALDIRNMLEALGYQVAGSVFSGEEAVKKAEELRPSLVLMDIMLSGEMTGIQAAERIYQRFSIPVIYLTAYAEKNTLEEAIRTGAFGYILKPFNERELKTSIETGLYKYTMESKLREREQWLSTLLRSIGDAVIATDGTGAITFMNPLAEALTGWDQGDVLRRSLRDVFILVDEASGEKIAYEIADMIEEVHGEHSGQGVLAIRGGDRTPIEYTFAPILGDNQEFSGVVLVFRDITQRKESEAELKTHESNLQRLSSQLINTQEAERGRLSRELHDEIGQALTAIKINLETLKREIPKDSTPVTQECLAETDTLTDNILDQIHQISLDLRPSILDDLGLVPTLNWYVKRFAQRMNIRVEFAPPGLKQRLDPELETVIYRIVQEALTNVAKHADARKVRLSLEQGEALVSVTIEDDGKGFDPEAVGQKTPENSGAGLLGIRERIMLLGGTSEIQSGTDRGTRITLRLPWRGEG